MLTSSKKVSYSYARRLLILPVAIGVLALLSFTIKHSLTESENKQSNLSSIETAQKDTIPAKYKDPKTGKIKGSFQIDIDGDMASFKDVKSKKELFKVPLSELSAPKNKAIAVQGLPIDVEKKVMFITGDSVSKPEFVFIRDVNLDSSIPGNEKGKKGAPRIIINGKEISPGEMDKIDPSGIKTISILGNESGVAVAGKNMNGMTWNESTSADGKKIVTVSVDSVVVDGKRYPVSAKTIAIAAESTEGKVKIQTTKIDTTPVEIVHGYKLAKTPKVISITTTDDNAASVFLKDPKTLNVTVHEADGDKKKTYTIIQKQTEKTELPRDVLYIIDGKEMESGSMKDVDPTTIKAINVLKGDGAVKKYGDKGKNGVIEITTKK